MAADIIFAWTFRVCSCFAFLFLIVGCKLDSKENLNLLRNSDLMLFDPHMPSFECRIEAKYVPVIDEQAHKWFLEARALEDPEIYAGDRDYKRIVELTSMAAERHHWKAILNLASLYVERPDLSRGPEEAIQLVEVAMRLGIPAAYDRMGTYYMNGVGLQADTTKAYAFWQQAALMGNPEAMAYLGSKLIAVTDDARPGYWSNATVAVKMLECALSQGYGRAAYELYDLYLEPRSPQGQVISGATDATKARAVDVLHKGVKFGCSECAIKLYLAFDPSKPSKTIAPFIDKARSERYRVLARALEFNPDLRFPNLDQILPLPPAKIPTWNGERKTLLDAAVGVKLSPQPAEAPRTLQSTGRQALDSAYRLRRGNEKTATSHALHAGYWKPTAPGHSEQTQRQLADIGPGLYAIGEAFDMPRFVDRSAVASGLPLVWEHWLTVANDDRKVQLTAAPGLTRTVPHLETLMHCAADTPCPTTGIWQPWIEPLHKLSGAVNQYWRQSWVLEGQSFPDPRRVWLMDMQADLITWHLLDPQGVSID